VDGEEDEENKTGFCDKSILVEGEHAPDGGADNEV
jgi:hypothetical protein